MDSTSSCIRVPNADRRAAEREVARADARASRIHGTPEGRTKALGAAIRRA
jgi:hypothetical protein